MLFLVSLEQAGQGSGTFFKCVSVASCASWLFFVGIVVFLLISGVITPPSVSIPPSAASRPAAGSAPSACSSPRQHKGLHRSTKGNSLVGVDRLVQVLSAEEVRHHRLDLRDTGRSSHQHNLRDGPLLNLRVVQHRLHRAQARLEQVRAQLLELRTCDRRVEVRPLKQLVDLNAGLCRRRQRTLGTLTGSAPTSLRTLVRRQVLLVLLLELLHEVVHHPVVEVLASQVGVSRSRLYLEDPPVNRQKRHIEGTATRVEDQDILLPRARVVESKRVVAASRRWVCSDSCCSAACVWSMCGGQSAVVRSRPPLDCVMLDAVVSGSELPASPELGRHGIDLHQHLGVLHLCGLLGLALRGLLFIREDLHLRTAFSAMSCVLSFYARCIFP